MIIIKCHQYLFPDIMKATKLNESNLLRVYGVSAKAKVLILTTVKDACK